MGAKEGDQIFSQNAGISICFIFLFIPESNLGGNRQSQCVAQRLHRDLDWGQHGKDKAMGIGIGVGIEGLFLSRRICCNSNIIEVYKSWNRKAKRSISRRSMGRSWRCIRNTRGWVTDN